MPSRACASIRALVLAAIGLTGVAGVPIPAAARDGVFEINQACATSTGCFAGDSPGFPVSISVAGSYVLTGNVSVSDANAIGIEISTDFVTIDLGGFSLSGPISCTGSGFNRSLVCGTGTGDGIIAGSYDGTAVRNGTLRGFADYGLYANGGEAQIEDMRFHEIGRVAVSVADGARIRNSTIYRNGGNGSSAALFASTGALIENLVVRQNQNLGAQVGSYSTIRGNTFSSNGLGGLTASLSTTVLNNTAAGNGGDGISVNRGCMVSDNVSSQNDGDGIQATSDFNVQRNNVSENGGYGLLFTGVGGAYRENQISSNATGSVLGGVNMGSNSCNGSTVCP